MFQGREFHYLLTVGSNLLVNSSNKFNVLEPDLDIGRLCSVQLVLRGKIYFYIDLLVTYLYNVSHVVLASSLDTFKNRLDEHWSCYKYDIPTPT